MTGTVEGVIGGAAAAIVGGLVGGTTGDVILSYATGDVIAGAGAGGDGVGGLIGTTTGAVSISYASGEVFGGANVGGLIGASTGTVVNTYATGSVNGNTNVGGLIGAATNLVSNSYASSAVIGLNPSTTGALIGSASVQNSNNFYNSDSNAETLPGVGAASYLGGVTGMTAAQMQDAANYSSSTEANGNLNPAWDLTDTWTILPGTLPFLRTFMTAVVVTADSSTKTYDGLADASAVSYSIAPLSSLGGTLSYSYFSDGVTTTVAPSDAGSYEVTPTGLLSTQKYLVSLVAGDALINPLTLTGGAIGDGASGYGSDTTLGVLSFDNTPSAGSALGPVSLVDVTYSTGGHVNAGSYDQTAAASTSGNYIYDSVTALLSNLVSAFEVTPTSTTNASVYNGTTDASLSIALAGVLDGDAVTVSGTGTLSSANAGTNTVAVSDLSLSGDDASNYFLGSTDGISTSVTTSALALTGGTISDATSVYGSDTTVGVLSFDNTPDDGSAVGEVVLVDATYSTGGNVNAGSYDQTAAASTSGNYIYDSVTALLNNVVSAFEVTSTSTTNASVYNGTTDASLSIALAGVLAGDAVSASGTGTLSSADAGTNTVTVSDLSLSGDDASNYFLASTDGVSTAVTTTALALTGGTISDATSVYGSDTTVGVLSFDNTPDAGSALGLVTLVDATYSTGGNVNAGSYDQTAAASTSGNYIYDSVTALVNNLVSALEVTPTSTTNASVYNGTTDVALSIALSNVKEGDVVSVSGIGTLSSPNAGINTVTVSDLSLSGDDASNYSLGSTDGVSTGVTTSALALTGGMISDATSVYGSDTTMGVLSFDNAPDAGSDLGLVTLVDASYSTGGYVNAGNYDQTVAASTSGNYIYDSVTALVNNVVSAFEVTSTSTTNASVYNGTTDASLSIALAGVLDGDAVAVSGTGTLSSADAGTNTVTVSDLRLSGDDASNYFLASTDGISTSVTTSALALTGGTISDATSVYGSDTTVGVLSFDNRPDAGSALGLVTLVDATYSTGGYVNAGSYDQTVAASTSGNYIYDSVTALVNNVVSAFEVTSTSTTNASVYNGTTDASLNIALAGVLDGDAVTVSGTGTLSSADAGTNTVTVSDLRLSGDDASNYFLASTDGISTSVTTSALALTGGTISDATSVYGSDTTVGVLSFDNTPDAGSDLGLVTLVDASYSAGGYVNAGSYDQTVAASTSGNYIYDSVTALVNNLVRTLEVTPTSTSTTSASVYNGTTDVALSIALFNVQEGDAVAVSGIGTLSSPNAGANTVAVSDLSLSGDDASNYSLSSTDGISINVITSPLALTGGTISDATSVYGSNTTVGVLSFDNTPDAGSAVGEVVLVDATYSTGGYVNAGSYDQTAAASTSGNYIYDSVTALLNNVVSAFEVTPTSTTNPSVYNGTTDASLSIALAGVLEGDAVAASGTGTLSSADAGINTVTVSDLSLSGDDASNYSLASTDGISTSVRTSALALTGGTISDATSVYGSDTAVGVLSFDNTPDAGSALGLVTLVDATYSTGGYVNADSYDQTAAASTSGNYIYDSVTALLNNLVSALDVTSTSTTNASVYNGSTDASLSIALAGVLEGDAVSASGTGTLSSPNVGTNTVTVSDLSLSGDDASNYALINTDGISTAVTTTALALTGGTISDATSVYGSDTAVGVLSFDNTPDAGSAVGEVVLVDATYSTGGHVNAGSYDQTVAASTSGNYIYDSVTALVNNVVSAFEVTSTSTTNASVYNGTTDASLSIALAGVLAGDAVSASGTGTLSSPDVGTNTVTVSDLILSGDDASNYSLSSTDGTSTNVNTSALALTGGTISDATSVFGSDTTVGVLSFDNTPDAGSPVGEVALVDPTYSNAGYVNVGRYDQTAAASSVGNYSYGSVTSLANNLVTAAASETDSSIDASSLLGGVNGKYFFSGLVGDSEQLNTGTGEFGVSLAEYYWGTPATE